MRASFLTGAILAVLLPANLDAQPGTAPAIESSATEGPLIWLEALGGSTGEVMKIHMVNPGPDPIEIDGYFAVEPVDLTPEERDRIFQSVKGAAGNHVEAVVDFYCLEFGAAAPAAGIVYRLAPRDAQEAFGPAARAMEAARELHAANLLSPDTNPESYFHAIRQWSIWTLEQGFDHDGFLEAFLEHTKKNLEAKGQRWSDAIEQVVRRSAEGRWRDITKVLEQAGLEAPAGGG